MRTTFLSDCVGVACKLIKSYDWKLYYKDSFDPDAGWVEDDLEGKLLTELDSPSLSIKGALGIFEEALFEETEYKYVSLSMYCAERRRYFRGMTVLQCSRYFF